MNFDVDAPINTGFNNFEKLGYIATTDLNPYTQQQYMNLAYNIIKKNRRYNIGLREWNHKDTADKTWDEFKPHLRTTHQELTDVSDKTVAYEGFQSANIVPQVVEGIVNALQPTDNDNDYTLIQMENAISQSTKRLPQLMQQMQQI